MLARLSTDQRTILAWVGIVALCGALYAAIANIDAIESHFWPPRPVPTVTIAAGDTPMSFVSVVGAARGGQASLSIEAAPGARCVASYETPRGTASKADGLNVAHVADEAGRASWTWTIGKSTEPGTGKVFATCGTTIIMAGIAIH